MRRIRTTFSTTTPESAERGDFADTGWVDQEGESMEPDEFDDEGTTATDKAADWLYTKGAFNDGGCDWFTTGWGTSNYRTGEEREENFHLVGFTPEEEAEVHTKLAAKRKAHEEYCRSLSSRGAA